MRTIPTSIALVDYCEGMSRGEIIVNHDYQRSDEIWPQTARSFLIESVVLGYPVPKISLHQVTDVRSRKVTKEIVDGQQRSTAIHAFFKGEFRLSKKLRTKEIAGRIYSELDEEQQKSFLEYQLSADLFVGTSVDEVREVFRRINAYTVPLNDEEKRHAEFQGALKWFINDLSSDCDGLFREMGVFGDKQLVRMQDMKLLADLCYAMRHGHHTTKGEELGELYKELDDRFPQEEDFRERIVGAMDQVALWKELFGTALMKQHIAFSLLLAVIHAKKPMSTLKVPGLTKSKGLAPKGAIVRRLSELAAAIDSEVETGPNARFVKASASKTNVGSQRATRFKVLMKAVTEGK